MNSAELLRHLNTLLACLADDDEHYGEPGVTLGATAPATGGTACIRHDPHTFPEPTIVTLDLPQASWR